MVRTAIAIKSTVKRIFLLLEVVFSLSLQVFDTSGLQFSQGGCGAFFASSSFSLFFKAELLFFAVLFFGELLFLSSVVNIFDLVSEEDV